MLTKYAFIGAAVLALAACQTAQEGEDAGTAGDGATTSGGTSGSGGTTSGGSGTSVPALVNVNLENILNNLSVDLKIDRANIPVNAQVPVTVAANVCGVSVSVLSLSTGGQASCTAKTTSPELSQIVQQQIAAGGNVGGGDQTTGGGSTNMI